MKRLIAVAEYVKGLCFIFFLLPFTEFEQGEMTVPKHTIIHFSAAAIFTVVELIDLMMLRNWSFPWQLHTLGLLVAVSFLVRWAIFWIQGTFRSRRNTRWYVR